MGKLDFFVAVERKESIDGAGVMALGPQGDGGRQGKHYAQGREDEPFHREESAGTSCSVGGCTWRDGQP